MRCRRASSAYSCAAVASSMVSTPTQLMFPLVALQKKRSWRSGLKRLPAKLSPSFSSQPPSV